MQDRNLIPSDKHIPHVGKSYVPTGAGVLYESDLVKKDTTDEGRVQKLYLVAALWLCTNDA